MKEELRSDDVELVKPGMSLETKEGLLDKYGRGAHPKKHLLHF